MKKGWRSNFIFLLHSGLSLQPKQCLKIDFKKHKQSAKWGCSRGQKDNSDHFLLTHLLWLHLISCNQHNMHE